mgnify:FL=1
MRIAFDSQIFCEQVYGGVSRYFSCLTEAFLSGGQDVHVFAPLHQNRYLERLPPGTVSGVQLPKCPPRAEYILRPLNVALARSRIDRWRPDLVHETYYTRSRTHSGRCPTVLTVHDMTHELFADTFNPNDPTRANKAFAVMRADHVICVSENTRRDLLTHYEMPQEKTSVVHLGYAPLKPPLGSNAILNQNAPYILYVGRRDYYKNFHGLLKAYAMSPRLQGDFRVVVFGGGALRRVELELMDELSIHRSRVVHLEGDDSDLSQAYEQASVFVYPSLYEGFGIPPLEAMSRSCPVVSSNSSSMPEVLGNAAQFCDPEQPGSICDGLEKVLYSSERASELVARGQERSAAFTWQRCADQTLEIYRELLGHAASTEGIY